VTLQLLLREYRAQIPDGGYEYSQFCARYRRYQQRVDLVLGKPYRPGAHCFVDYAGPTVPIMDPHTGTRQSRHMIVPVLGYSNYTFNTSVSSTNDTSITEYVFREAPGPVGSGRSLAAHRLIQMVHSLTNE
jgi:transposase